MANIFLISGPPGDRDRPKSFLSSMIRSQSKEEDEEMNEEFKNRLIELLDRMDRKLERLPESPTTHVGGG